MNCKNCHAKDKLPRKSGKCYDCENISTVKKGFKKAISQRKKTPLYDLYKKSNREYLDYLNTLHDLTPTQIYLKQVYKYTF